MPRSTMLTPKGNMKRLVEQGKSNKQTHDRTLIQTNERAPNHSNNQRHEEEPDEPTQKTNEQ